MKEKHTKLQKLEGVRAEMSRKNGDPQDSCLGGFYGGRRFGGDAFDGGTGD